METGGRLPILTEATHTIPTWKPLSYLFVVFTVSHNNCCLFLRRQLAELC